MSASPHDIVKNWGRQLGERLGAKGRRLALRLGLFAVLVLIVIFGAYPQIYAYYH